MNDIPIAISAEIAIMSSVEFNQSASEELIQKLGSTIVRGEGYKSHIWDSLSLVFELDGQESQFGYIYTDSGEWKPATPGGFDALDIALELQETSQAPGKSRWKKALVQIKRNTGKIDIEFDYEGVKWVPDMADPKGFAMGLKPAG